MSNLIAHRYGKARVRVLKVLRDGEMHRLKDIDAAAFLQGDLVSSYTSGDNTGLGFENYPRDEFTTLRETADRILATSFSGTWSFETLPEDFRQANAAILSAMLKIFAEKYSPSAQTTLFQMDEAALASCPEIFRLDLAMPNKHCLLIDLSPFDLENKNEVFVPTDEQTS